MNKQQREKAREEKRAAIYEYVQNHSVKDTAIKYKVSTWTVYDIRKSYKVITTSKPKSDQKQLSSKEKQLVSALYEELVALYKQKQKEAEEIFSKIQLITSGWNNENHETTSGIN